MATPSIYLRAKRENQTAFLNCEPGDTMLLIKTRLQEITRIDSDRIRIYGADKETIFEDESTVADHRLKDNNVIYYVFKGETGDVYEEIKPQVFGDGDDAGGEAEGSESKK